MSCFNYLEVVLHSANTRKIHRRLHCWKCTEEHNCPAQISQDKKWSLYTYSTQTTHSQVNNTHSLQNPVGPFYNFAPLQYVQSNFLTLALEILKCDSNASLRLGTGSWKWRLECGWPYSITGWNSHFFLFDPATLTTRDDFQSTWKRPLQLKPHPWASLQVFYWAQDMIKLKLSLNSI